MEPGFYWLHLQDEDPEVVEIIDNSMYRCGSDVTCFFEDGQWIELFEPMDVVSISGPIFAASEPPPIDASSSERFNTFKAALEDLCLRHRIQLSTSQYDGLQAWNLEDRDDPIYSAGFENCISK